MSRSVCFRNRVWIARTFLKLADSYPDGEEHAFAHAFRILPITITITLN